MSAVLHWGLSLSSWTSSDLTFDLVHSVASTVFEGRADLLRNCGAGHAFDSIILSTELSSDLLHACLEEMLIFSVNELCPNRVRFIEFLQTLTEEDQYEIMNIIQRNHLNNEPSTSDLPPLQCKCQLVETDVKELSCVCNCGGIRESCTFNIMEDKIANLTADLLESNGNIEFLDKQVADLKKELVEMARNSERILSEVETNLIEKHANEIKELNWRITQAENEKKKLKIDYEQFHELRDKVDCFEDVSKDLIKVESALKRCQNELKEARFTITQLKCNEEDNAKLLARCIAAETKARQLEEIRKQLASTKQSWASLEVEARDMRIELSSWKLREQQLLDTIMQLKCEGKIAIEESLRLKSDLESKCTNVSGIKEFDAIGNGIHELNPAIAEELARLRSDNERLTQNADHNTAGTVKNLELKLEDANNLCDAYSDNLRDVRSNLKSTRDECDKTALELKASCLKTKELQLKIHELNVKHDNEVKKIQKISKETFQMSSEELETTKFWLESALAESIQNFQGQKEIWANKIICLEKSVTESLQLGLEELATRKFLFTLATNRLEMLLEEEKNKSRKTLSDMVKIGKHKYEKYQKSLEAQNILLKNSDKEFEHLRQKLQNAEHDRERLSSKLEEMRRSIALKMQEKSISIDKSTVASLKNEMKSLEAENAALRAKTKLIGSNTAEHNIGKGSNIGELIAEFESSRRKLIQEKSEAQFLYMTASSELSTNARHMIEMEQELYTMNEKMLKIRLRCSRLESKLDEDTISDIDRELAKETSKFVTDSVSQNNLMIGYDSNKVSSQATSLKKADCTKETVLFEMRPAKDYTDLSFFTPMSKERVNKEDTSSLFIGSVFSVKSNKTTENSFESNDCAPYTLEHGSLELETIPESDIDTSLSNSSGDGSSNLTMRLITQPNSSFNLQRSVEKLSDLASPTLTHCTTNEKISPNSYQAVDSHLEEENFQKDLDSFDQLCSTKIVEENKENCISGRLKKRKSSYKEREIEEILEGPKKIIKKEYEAENKDTILDSENPDCAVS